MRISLITTTRNRAGYLLYCAESVAAQVIKPYQWVIYIDDSIDNYADTITKIEELLPDVILTIIGGEFVGRVKALNIAHASATGDYFALLDDDDWLDPNCLLECTTRNAYSYDIIYTDFYTINVHNQKYIGIRNQRPYSWEEMLTNNIMFHFRLYKASLYNQVGGHDESYETTMDYEITLRMLKLKPSILKIDIPLYYYRVHNNSISGTKNSLQVANAARARALYRRTVN